MAERLTSIRDKAELRVALEGAPDPDSPPAEVVGKEKVIWRNYCRYYRKRLDSIAEDFKRKGLAKHRSPRCFDSYCEALGRSRQRPVTEPVSLGEPGERGFKKAVLPERGSSKSGGGPSGLVLTSPAPGESESEDAVEAAEAAEAPEQVEPPGLAEEAAPPSDPPAAASSFAAMGTEMILAQIERDIDNAMRALSAADATIPTTLCYDSAKVPMEMRPILKEYAEQYASSRWQRPVRVAFEAVFS